MRLKAKNARMPAKVRFQLPEALQSQGEVRRFSVSVSGSGPLRAETGGLVKPNLFAPLYIYIPIYILYIYIYA